MKTNMSYMNFGLIVLLFLSSLVSILHSNQPNAVPYLSRQGDTIQLIVDGEPFLICGGELGNSSFTSLEYMQPIWPKLTAMNLNTVLAPVYWELIEPQEGEFDFALYDQLIEQTRQHDLKLVLLWFASWKNSMSSHAPAWVKQDQQRFPRVKDDKGNSHEILTPFSENNRDADARAFRALMRHIREIDEQQHTVIMVQPENEIGMLPVARDYHPLANEKFKAPVPQELMDYLVEHKENLVPEFNAMWEKNGFTTAGTWEDIFGSGPHTGELFMAWFYAKYTNTVVQAGKAEYPLPMFVNAALPRPGRQPGTGYPSAGPLPHLMDVWRAGAPDIDFLSPDFYNPDFERWCDLYTRQGNPLFVPEHGFDDTVAAKAAFAFGRYEAFGFAPFSIESTDQPETEPLGKLYGVVEQLAPVITAHHGQNNIDGVLLEKENPEMVLHLGDYKVTVRHSYTLGYEPASQNETWAPAGAVFVRTDDNEFYVAGSGVVMTFKHLEQPEFNVGILKVDQGRFVNGEWQIIRHLNGDQTHQGRHVRLFHDDFSILRFELYQYK